MRQSPDIQAVVLAGGFGTRLRSRVADLPKAMAPVAGRPFLEYVLDRLVDSGVARIVLATGYLSETIESHFGGAYRGVPVGYSREDTPLGTGGAIAKALRALPAQTTVVLNGDTWLDVDLTAFHTWCLQQPGVPGLVLREVRDVSRFGAVALDGERIDAFGEKQTSGRGFVNAGVYGLALSHFDGFGLPEVFSIETDFFQRCIGRRPLRGFPCRGEFIDIGVPDEFDRAQADLPRWQQR